MRCTRCDREFCYVCGDDWAPPHYNCFQTRAPHGTTDDEAGGGRGGHGGGVGRAAGGAWAARQKEERRARCVHGHDSWAAIAGDQPMADWPRLCGDGAAVLLAAGAALAAAQAAVRRGASAMACSFAVEWAMADGVRLMRARKRLRGLREGLERDLHALAGVLVAPGARPAPEDLREPVGLAMLLESDTAQRARLDRLRERVRARTAVMVAAGRARDWSAPTRVAETVLFLAGEGLTAASRVASSVLLGGARLLGLVE
jgi:hypothetical protein